MQTSPYLRLFASFFTSGIKLQPPTSRADALNHYAMRGQSEGQGKASSTPVFGLNAMCQAGRTETTGPKMAGPWSCPWVLWYGTELRGSREWVRRSRVWSQRKVAGRTGTTRLKTGSWSQHGGSGTVQSGFGQFLGPG